MENYNQNFTLLNASKVAYVLSDIYSGPFLLPRATVIMQNKEGHVSAISAMHITPDNPFMQMHRHAFPGVIMVEFAQQLAVLITKEVLQTRGLPYMRKIIELENFNPAVTGDTILCQTTLTKHKLRTYFFNSSILKNDGAQVLSFSFVGMSS